MQIDWSKAPEWAMWHAFDKDGWGYWYSDKPIQRKVCFVYLTGRSRSSVYNYNKRLSTWKDTLEQRPTQPDYTAQLLAIVEQQKAKGLAKYGVALEGANLSAVELIDHALEEICDQAFYMLALRDKLRKDVTQ